jgi:hypothetical protein
LYYCLFSNWGRNEKRRTGRIRKNYRNSNDRSRGSKNRAKAFRWIKNQRAQTRR